MTTTQTNLSKANADPTFQPTLDYLLVRLRGGGGIDRELDALIWCREWGYTVFYSGRGISAHGLADTPVQLGEFGTGKTSRKLTLHSQWESRIPKFTKRDEGVGHCQATMGHLLPGWGWVKEAFGSPHDVLVIRPDEQISQGKQPVFSNGRHHDLGYALLIAIFSALRGGE